MSGSERNYGIDLLRLVSMFLVVVLHVLGHGGVLNSAQGINYYLSWLLEVVSYCAVDCFALISGYVGFHNQETHYNYNKYGVIYLMAITYSCGISSLALLVFGVGSLKDILLSALLITTNRYWYFTAYTGLFFLIPWINKLIRACTNKQLNYLVVTILCLFSFASIVPCFIGEDIFSLESGYSLIWLVVLFIIGAWIKTCEINTRIRISRLGMLACLGIVITWVLKTFFNKGFLVNYISPTILVFSIFLVIIFSKIRLRNSIEQLVKWYAPVAFDVYIIHIHNIILNGFLLDKFIWIASVAWWQMILLVLGFSAIIFIICIHIGKIRLFIFDSLHISPFAMRIMDKLIRLFSFLLTKIQSLLIKNN